MALLPEKTGIIGAVWLTLCDPERTLCATGLHLSGPGPRWLGLNGAGGCVPAWWAVRRRAGKRKLLRSGKQLRPPACHQGLKLRLESVGVGIFMVGNDEGCGSRPST